jgi:glycosyltransferase involved in cell wall biosynthesis
MISRREPENQPGTSGRDFAPMQLDPLPERPLVSVLIPSYNYSRYIGITLQSLLDQSYQNFEAIVCDDGSTDNSIEIIQKYAARDSRITLLVKEHSGIVGATNSAYAASKGEIVSLLDSDDVFKPSKVEKVVAAFRANPRSGVFMNAVQPVSAAGQPFGEPVPPAMDQGWLAPAALRRGGVSRYPPGPGLSFRREVVSELFPLPLRVTGAQDSYLILCAQFITEVSATAECLTDYRIHGSNTFGLHKPYLFPKKSEIESAEEFFSIRRAFLERVYGPEIASKMSLDDVEYYWRTLLAYRVLQGRRAGAIRPFTVKEMIGHVGSGRERRIWQLISKLPDPLAKRAYGLWRGSSAWERAVRLVFRRWV